MTHSHLPGLAVQDLLAEAHRTILTTRHQLDVAIDAWMQHRKHLPVGIEGDGRSPPFASIEEAQAARVRMYEAFLVLEDVSDTLQGLR